MVNNKRLITGRVRGSYVNIFRPRLNDLSGEEEYSMSLLIPKTDKKTVDRIQEIVEDVIKEKWGAKRPAKLRTPLRDGDAERPEDEAYKGVFFMNVKSKQPPGIIDKDRQPVLDSSEFLSGDYCRCSLNAYPYDQKGNSGVSFGLNNVQIIAKGTPLSGRARAEDDFSAWTDEDWG